MVRIILEDMKLNKNRGKVPLKKEVITPVKTIFPETDIPKENPIHDQYLKNKLPKRQRLQRTPQTKTRSRILNKYVLLIFVLAIIFGGIYWIGNFFQKADITLTPKQEHITYNNKQFTASKNPTDNAIDFEIMIISDKKSKGVILTEAKDLSIKATGSVTLYNEFSTAPQKLSAGTFLSDSEGKAYKTDSAVIIPGYKTDSNKKIIPGQIVATISSFLVGEAYNGAPTDFYINSFKGTTKYNKIYGKLKSPLVGGVSGLVYTLNDKDKINIDKIAQSSFKGDLSRQVLAQVPPGYILYPDAMTFSYKIGDSSVYSKTPGSEVQIEGVLSVVLLKEKSLLDNIIKVSLPEIKGEELKEIKIPDLSKMIFSFTNKDQLITKDMNSLSFFFTGELDAIWNPDKELLKTKLIGVSKNDVLPIFHLDPGISSALVKIFPPWQNYIPEDLSKINIKVDE